jgi:hypothetical protein
MVSIAQYLFQPKIKWLHGSLFVNFSSLLANNLITPCKAFTDEILDAGFWILDFKRK